MTISTKDFLRVFAVVSTFFFFVLLLAVQAAPAYSYAISITKADITNGGRTLTISGPADITNYAGDVTKQFVVFEWGDGSREVLQASSFPAYTVSGTNIQIHNFSRSHTYNTVSGRTVKVSIQRGQSTTPAQYGSFTIQTENTSARCADKLDNDKDGKTDMLDSDCAAFAPPTTLRIVNTLINDNGGAKTVSNFSFSLDGGVPIAFGGAGQNTITVSPGPHTVTGVAMPGYTTSYNNCSLSIATSTAATCTITNDDIAPRITVTTDVINDDGGSATAGDFSLKIGAVAVLSGVPTALSAGAYTVSASGQSGYTIAFGGDCATDGTVTLALGDTRNCTVTADDMGDEASFRGIYAVTQQLSAPDRSLAGGEYGAVYAMPAVDGVFVRLQWNVIEPSRGVYDWATLDRDVAAAVENRKKISVGFMAGEHAPSWLAGAGAQRARFSVVGSRSQGNCIDVDIYLPWDPDYIREYGTAMSALSAHLHSLPGAYEAITIVKLTGINQETLELRLPNTSTNSDSCLFDNADIWQSVDYLPSKVVDAWTQLANATNAAFPDKILSIAVLENNDFPSFDAQGNLVSKSKMYDVKGAIIQKGLSLFQGRFGVQWQGLSRWKAAQVVIDAAALGAIAGWQTNQQGGGYDGGSDCRAAENNANLSCTNTLYQQILDKGINASGQFIEIWPVDALDFPSATSHAHTRLTQ